MYISGTIVLLYQHIVKKAVNFYPYHAKRRHGDGRMSRKALVHLLLFCAIFLNLGAASAHDQTDSGGSSQPLPAFSELIRVGKQQFHLRNMAPSTTVEHLPVVVLLAGPNQNFHADSAWFALLQPLLAKKYQVVAIDRLGNGFSDNADDLSYRRFSEDLAKLLPLVTRKPVILVSFASASISARLLQQKQDHPAQSQVQAMLWIDPDIATPEALRLYQGYPVDWYQKHLQQLLPELAKGVWDQRTQDKLTAERAEVAGLIDDHHQALMDWAYFDAISSQRQSRQRQQQRAIEIANYAKDLDLYVTLPTFQDIPISIIDSDFESSEIQALQAFAAQPAPASEDPNQQAARQQALKSNAEQINSLQRWQQQGSVWSQQLTAATGGQYKALTQSHHLVMFQHPKVIVEAVDWLSAKIKATTNTTSNSSLDLNRQQP